MKQTRWQVFTGAPCSGKTTVLRKLAESGFQVVHEAARAIINEALDNGKSLEDIRRNDLAFQQAILKRKYEVEQALPPESVVFLDRGIPDSIAYYQLSKLSEEVPIAQSRIYQYEAVFHFEMLPFRQDRARNEDKTTALRLDRLILDAYHSLGYHPIRVPVMSVKERVQFILERI